MLEKRLSGPRKLRILAKMACAFSPWNSRRPVRSSKHVTPTDQRSTLEPQLEVLSTTSGAMYAGVPTHFPQPRPRELSPDSSPPSASSQGAEEAASPKSMTLQSGLRVAEDFDSIIFAGLMSRWTMPCSWQWATAESSCRTRRATSASFRPPPSFSRSCAQLPPWTYSRTRMSWARSTSSAYSWSLTMWGWSSCARTRTSFFMSSSVACLMFIVRTFLQTRSWPVERSFTSSTRPKEPSPSGRTDS
mmetsp:Transcript_3711/g.11329  ORF Transcript_3711/g.11329 Transcript_3711/m.11329 type:complete len:246 (-) Transcript_3711:326-1063(-)